MLHIPQIEPVSRLARKHKDILGMLINGPVILSQRSKPAAVIVSVDEWKSIVQKLEELEDAYDVISILKAELAIAKGETKSVPADIEELEKWANRVSA